MERVIIRSVRHGKGAEGMEIRRGMFGRRGSVDGKKTEEAEKTLLELSGTSWMSHF